MEGTQEIDITESELVDALVQAQRQQDPGSEGVTVGELGDTLDRSDKWVRLRLKRLKKENRVRVVRRARETIDDRIVSVPAYILIPGDTTGDP